MSTQDTLKPNLILSVLHNNCPRCRRGKLFTQSNPYKLNGMMKMNEKCEVCGQTTDMEPGFYYGTSYVSYGLAIAVTAATLVAWWVLIGFSLQDNRFFWWMGINAFILIAMQPLLMRWSRTIWLSFFIYYSPRWNEGDVVVAERTNDGLKNAW
ncbi:MAG TPA: hypothetical protein VM187_03755 [Niastella sp.]|nr:hypothetical protein [Niastella sp.]